MINGASDFQTIRSNTDGLSYDQVEEYSKKFIGEKINWQGIVHEVVKTNAGEYEIHIAMDWAETKLKSIYNVSFIIPEYVEPEIINGSTVLFDGCINSVFNTYGNCQIFLKDGNIKATVVLEDEETTPSLRQGEQIDE